MRMQCLRLLTQVVPLFSKPLSAHMPAVMSAAWAMYSGALPTFVVSERVRGGKGPGCVVHSPVGSSKANVKCVMSRAAPCRAQAQLVSEPQDGSGGAAPLQEVDSEGDVLDLEALVAQVGGGRAAALGLGWCR